jgi:alanyl-tRNA synthetase
MISSKELRQKYLDFMASKGHVIFPSASLVPKEDPTVLFNTAGMQPIIPYLTGTKHPLGDMLANSQKCLRTLDIEEVGDNRHLTFFEMLGNWSLGAYFKEEIIPWTFEFMTSLDYLGLDPKRLFVTVYKGGDLVGVDMEAVELWKNQFESVGLVASVGDELSPEQVVSNDVPEDIEKTIPRITLRSGVDNWWSLPYTGPCGPCSEIYYLLNTNDTDLTKTLEGKSYSEIADFVENQIIEVWNNVFMAYIGDPVVDNEPVKITPLEHKNIDTGGGFERLLTVINGFETPYETDVLKPLVDIVKKYQKTSTK